MATNPSYLNLNLGNIHNNTMGFSYNYPIVDTEIRRFISDFKRSNNAAAVQADVVAHGMGGDIVRTIASEPGFAGDETYGNGPIDKFITIGTPHLGTPLATQLLDPANACVRRVLASSGKKSFLTVTTTGGTLNGAVGDLQGDGYGVSLTQALRFFYGVQPPFAMALVSATENENNLSGLNCTTCAAALLRAGCGQLFQDPLAKDLTQVDGRECSGRRAMLSCR